MIDARAFLSLPIRPVLLVAALLLDFGGCRPADPDRPATDESLARTGEATGSGDGVSDEASFAQRAWRTWQHGDCTASRTFGTPTAPPPAAPDQPADAGLRGQVGDDILVGADPAVMPLPFAIRALPHAAWWIGETTVVLWPHEADDPEADSPWTTTRANEGDDAGTITLTRAVDDPLLAHAITIQWVVEPNDGVRIQAVHQSATAQWHETLVCAPAS